MLGTPPDAEHVRYQRTAASELRIPVADELPAAAGITLDRIADGADRRGAQREVPLLVWRTPVFRSWLSAQEGAGNELRGARVEWTCRVSPERTTVLFSCVQVSVWIAREQRLKSNEVIIGRPDVTTVVAYRRGESLEQTEIVLVREFRSPAVTADGYVRELPGGSTFTPNVDPAHQAVEERREETGLVIAPGTPAAPRFPPARRDRHHAPPARPFRRAHRSGDRHRPPRHHRARPSR